MRTTDLTFVAVYVALCLSTAHNAHSQTTVESAATATKEDRMPANMTFMSTFDDVTDSNLFATHGWICTADSTKRKNVVDHFHPDYKSAKIVKDAGVSGDCLRFTSKSKQALMYKSEDGADFYPRDNWNGTVSFWLKLDPNKDLGDGYCDPIQIAGRKWNDGSLWVDFDKVKPRTFRLGVYSDYKVWNPKDVKWEEFPEADKPQIVVHNPPFASSKWTHVCFTFAGINSTKDQPAKVKLFLDGNVAGKMDRLIKIHWEKDDPTPAIFIGLSYIGDFDELQIFDRALPPEEVAKLNKAWLNQ